MDSSSEGSFAWTDASDDTTDNEDMAKTKLSVSQSGEESESGENYKKKLQRRLFSEHTDAGAGTEAPRAGKRARPRAADDDSDAGAPSRRKRIKLEPESDVDKTNKNKYKTLDPNADDSPRDSYDESFLNLKVKSEDSFAVPSAVKAKKNKKKSTSSSNEFSVSNGDVEAPSNSVTFSDENNIITNDSTAAGSDHMEEDVENECDTIKIKKKKKKKSRQRSLSSEKEDNEKNITADDTFYAEETVVEERPTPSKDERSENSSSIAPPERSDVCESRTHNNNTPTIKQNDDKVATLNGEHTPNTALQNNSNSLFDKRKSRMSERIQFEEEEDSDVPSKSINNASTISIESKKSKLISYIESNKHLKLVHMKRASGARVVLSEDDDVWVVRCPKEVRAEAFQDKKWILDSKCKIKLGGHTYEGDIQETGSDATILQTAANRPVMKNIAINGCIRLRRKLPKAHVQEDNIIVNNRSDFIPLPPTKCRHPLLGSHYKKAMKLSAAVVERLREACVSAPAPAPAIITSKKKKKKRKRSDTTPPAATTASTAAAGAGEEESAPRHRRRHKRDLHSPNAWDSEKAIEENLFNF